MKTISIHDAKTNLSKYISAAKNGEKIYIGGFGKAEVLLIKMPKYEVNKGERSFIVGKDKIIASPDAFTTSTDSLISELMLSD
ncbi:MAG TPA: type II toxin-antitoxin system Phd/YefM family antitoxin [Candidatus Saccharimonadales bacterium]